MKKNRPSASKGMKPLPRALPFPLRPTRPRNRLPCLLPTAFHVSRTWISARISRLLAPNSLQANPFQPDSFSVAEVTAYHDIILDLLREFCEAYPAGSVEHRGRVFLYHNFEEVFRSLIWHQVENDKKERDEEKALNEGTQR
ncbi:hypothetical protein Pst134EB_010090 [Puccinia striiformis f. sp. tritici]|nr:hypothetical protein Pst134EB_010090 [Puccinia striiformis f. sp. tritici]